MVEGWQWHKGSRGCLGQKSIVGHGEGIGTGIKFDIHRGPLYIRQLTDECSSSVDHIFLDFGTKEYRTVIFLGAEEDKKLRNVHLFPVVHH
jgi:hypothetical protein